MTMNFFKKVMTFFSIIWNAILWRKTVKDKKSKAGENEAAGNEAPSETETVNQAEEAEKAFVDVSLHTPAFEDADGFLIDSENELHDPILIQDVSELTSPVVAQYLNSSELAEVDHDSSRDTEVEDLTHNNLSGPISGYPHDETLLSDSKAPFAEGTVLSATDDLHVGNETNNPILSDCSGHLSRRNDPIVEALIIQTSSHNVLLEELKDDFEKDSSKVRGLQNQVNPVLNTESLGIVEILSGKPADEVGDHSIFIKELFSPEQDILVPENLEITDPFIDTLCTKLSKHDLDSSLVRSPSLVKSVMNLVDEEEVYQTFDKIVKIVNSDGDYVPLVDIVTQEEVVVEKVDQEIFPNDNYWDGQQPKENDKDTKDEMQNEDRTVTNELDTPAVESSENVCDIMDDCSTEVSRYYQVDDGISAPESSVFTGVQTSISSVKLTENVKCSEIVSAVQLSVDYSTNYMVRSDSLVNFLPNAHFPEKPEAATIFHSLPESNDDSIWISDTVSIIPEINVEAASASACCPVEQSCLEEIMCTSTGILKLSESCGEVRCSVDVVLEENSTPENEISEQIKQITPVTQSGFPLPCVFRYDVGGVNSDIENLGLVVDVENDVPRGQEPQSDIQNFRTRTPRFDSKGKELGQKIHNKEENNEQSSTKSEDDTMENIDELSYDVNVNIFRGGNVVQDIESQREEFHLDPVPGSSPKSTQVNDVSVGTGTNENLPSLPKSEIYFQGRTNSLGQPDDNFIQNMGAFDSPDFSLEMSPNVPNYNFSDEFVPQIIPADYNANISTVPVSFGGNAVNLDDSIPIVSVGMTSYYGASKWQEPIPCTAQGNTGAINFDTGGLRFISKNESLFYTHMRPENKSLNDGSDSYIGKLNNELYPFIDGASYLFGIPEEVRKDDYFNPCVGAAPSGRGISGKTIDNSKCEALKVGGFSLDEQNNLVGRREQSWSMGQRLLQHDLFPLAEGIESNYRDGCYRSAMAVQVESEHLQKNNTQPSTVWNASEQILPVQKTSSYHNGFESSEQYPPAQETVHQHPVDFVPIDYLQGAVYENDQETVCNTTNGYEFINPYEVGVFPMLNIPFCLPDPSYVQRGPIPPFVFPIGPVNMEQNEGPPVQLETDTQNGLYPLTSHPYWVGFQADGNGSRAQDDISIKNEIPAAEMNRNYPPPQICANEPVEEHDNDTEECPIPDPYFQLAENSSLHSVKSKAESYNGSLFCESLRSIMSSHNAESDNVLPSFSCSSMKCYNPSLVVRSCETSLSNDSLPSIIVEGSYSKSVDEDYPAKEKFMNDVNTALNESMMDQILCSADEFPISFLGRGDFEAELMGTSVDIVPEDIERTLHVIMETNDESERNNNIEEEYSGHTIIYGERMEEHNLEPLNIVEEDGNTAIQESEVNEILTEILMSVVDFERMENSCLQSEALVYDDQDSSQTVEHNRLETWNVSQMEEENTIVQHNVVEIDGISLATDSLVRPPADGSIEIEGSNEDGKIYGNNEMVNRIVGDKNATFEVLEVPFEGTKSGLVNADVDDRGHLVNMNAHRRESTWNLQDTENLVARVDDRGTERECEEKLVSCSTEMSAIGKNLSKSKRNFRRKKKGAGGTKSEGMITEKIGIGDGSTQQEVVEQRLDKQENQTLEVTNFEHITVPEAIEGMVGEPSGSHENQERGQDMKRGSLGKSSKNTKIQNKKKRRRN